MCCHVAVCASSKLYWQIRLQISPNKKRELSLHKLAIYSGVCRERFRCPRAAHLRVSLSLYDVSVRSLAALAGMCPAATNQADSYASHSQASFPRSITLPQLPSPRTSIDWLHWVYCLQINSRFRTGDLHPTSSRPCWAYRSTRAAVVRVLKWMRYPRRQINAVVLPFKVSSKTDGENLYRNDRRQFLLQCSTGAGDGGSPELDTTLA